MPHITYNVKLEFESGEQKDNILDTLKAEQYVFNECSKKHFGSKKNSIVDLHEKIYKCIRKSRPDIPSQIIIRGENDCLSAYRTVKSNKHKITKPILKTKLSMRLDKRLFAMPSEDSIKLTNVAGKRITAKLEVYPKFVELYRKHRFCDPLIFEREGKIWLAVTFDIPDDKINPESVTGIDLGIKRAVTTSDGIILRDKEFNREKRQLRFLKRKLQSCGTKSARKHLRKVRRKERHKNRDQSHKLANFILNNSPGNIIAVENLKNIKTKTFSKNKHQNNKWAQVPVAQLVNILSYKALLRKKTVIKVSPTFTSQIDHRTGLKDGIRQKSRYICKDGTVLDADVNAAINIRNRAMSVLDIPFKLPNHKVSHNCIFGQALVTEPKAIIKPNVCKSDNSSDYSEEKSVLQAPGSGPLNQRGF